MQTIEIWAEGFRKPSGELTPPVRILSGEVSSLTTFRQTCKIHLAQHSAYNPRLNLYWGCKLYPTLAEAQAATDLL